MTGRNYKTLGSKHMREQTRGVERTCGRLASPAALALLADTRRRLGLAIDLIRRKREALVALAEGVAKLRAVPPVYLVGVGERVAQRRR